MKPTHIHNTPTIFVILGATGDLMARKIIPSLFHLYTTDQLPKLSKFIAFSRRELTDGEYQDFVKESLGKRSDGKDLEKFLALFSYHQGDFNTLPNYQSLAEKLGRIDGEWKTCSNKLFYLAVPPQYYETIFEHLKVSGLTIPCGGEDEGWTRILVEKPFGKDFETAKALDMRLGELFKEEQIYRIDHYLAKEMIQNILSFRFSNNLFEEIWNNKFIEKIEVRLLEDLGIEGRVNFYDGVGALRDVGQNHLLQMLSLVTMGRPFSLDAEFVRKKRAQVLKDLKKLSVDDARHQTYRAQVEGYQDLPGVAKNSATETYFRVIAQLDNNRFRDVPIILEAGKSLERKKEIVVTFKHPTPCFCPPDTTEHFTNKFTFSLEPEEEICIEFWVKKPGLTYEMVRQDFSFSYKSIRKDGEMVEEYEKLLQDCIAGNQLLFVSTEEVLSMWQFIDPIESAWEKGVVPLVMYKPNDTTVLEKARIFAEQQVPQTMLKKQVGIIGLGKMGLGFVEKLREKNWQVVAYNRSPESTESFIKDGGVGVYALKEFAEKLVGPRIILVSVPNNAVDEVLFGKDGIVQFLEKGDIVVDMGNSYYEDSVKRFEKIRDLGIHFVDVGVSGGPSGARYGASLMIGGEKESFDLLYPLFQDLAVADGIQFFEGSGAGHFVKMIHNGIEYGMMQAIAEGFAVMEKSEYKLDLKDIASVYNHGSVIESRLMGWLTDAFEIYGQDLKNVSGSVAHTGEGQWTIDVAKQLKIKAKVIEDALEFRKESEKNPSYTGKILSALRNRFGGHAIKNSSEK